MDEQLINGSQSKRRHRSRKQKEIVSVSHNEVVWQQKQISQNNDPANNNRTQSDDQQKIIGQSNVLHAKDVMSSAEHQQKLNEDKKPKQQNIFSLHNQMPFDNQNPALKHTVKRNYKHSQKFLKQQINQTGNLSDQSQSDLYDDKFVYSSKPSLQVGIPDNHRKMRNNDEIYNSDQYSVKYESVKNRQDLQDVVIFASTSGHRDTMNQNMIHATTCMDESELKDQVYMDEQLATAGADTTRCLITQRDNRKDVQSSQVTAHFDKHNSGKKRKQPQININDIEFIDKQQQDIKVKKSTEKSHEEKKYRRNYQSHVNGDMKELIEESPIFDLNVKKQMTSIETIDKDRQSQMKRVSTLILDSKRANQVDIKSYTSKGLSEVNRAAMLNDEFIERHSNLNHVQKQYIPLEVRPIIEDMNNQYMYSMKIHNKESKIEPSLYLRRTANVISGMKLDYSIDPFKLNGLKSLENPGFFFPTTETLKHLFGSKSASDNYDKFANLLNGHDIFIHISSDEDSMINSLKSQFRGAQKTTAKNYTLHIKYLGPTDQKDQEIRERLVPRLLNKKDQVTEEQLSQRILKVTKEKRIDCDLIEDFIFGGQSSRFWILKNFINLQSNSDLPAKMLCWNMISIKIKGNDTLIDLVIPNEQEMNVLIQFLIECIYRSNKKQQEEQQRKAKIIQNLEQYQRKYTQDYSNRSNGGLDLNRQASTNSNASNASKNSGQKRNARKRQRGEPDFYKALLVYKIMRIRMKISYHAWKQGITVKELLFNQILNSYLTLSIDRKKPLLDIEEILKPQPLLETLKLIHKLNRFDIQFCKKTANNIFNEEIEVNYYKNQRALQFDSENGSISKSCEDVGYLNSYKLKNIKMKDSSDMHLEFEDAEKNEQNIVQKSSGQQQQIVSSNNNNCASGKSFLKSHNCNMSYHEIHYRQNRLRLLVIMSDMFKIHKNNPIKDVQLKLYREQISREAFCKEVKCRNWSYFRIPQEMSQELLPMAFQYYNSSIPLLTSFEDECLLEYMQLCREQMDQELLKKEHKRQRKQKIREQRNNTCIGFLDTFCDKIYDCIVKKSKDEQEMEEEDLKRLSILLKIQNLQKEALEFKEQSKGGVTFENLDQERFSITNSAKDRQKQRAYFRSQRVKCRQQLKQLAIKRARSQLQNNNLNNPQDVDFGHSAASTFKFVKKQFGQPTARRFNNQCLPDKKLQILNENQVEDHRNKMIGSKLILYNKFTKMKYKVRYIDSDIQRQQVPRLIKGRDLQFLRIENHLKMKNNPNQENQENKDDIDSDDLPTQRITTDYTIYLTEKGAKRMAHVERLYSQDLRQMEKKLHTDPQFVKDFSNTYRYLLQKAKKMELLILQAEKRKQWQNFQDEIKTIKNYDRKQSHLEMNLQKAYNFGQQGDVKKLIKKLMKKNKFTEIAKKQRQLDNNGQQDYSSSSANEHNDSYLFTQSSVESQAANPQGNVRYSKYMREQGSKQKQISLNKNQRGQSPFNLKKNAFFDITAQVMQKQPTKKEQMQAEDASTVELAGLPKHTINSTNKANKETPIKQNDIEMDIHGDDKSDFTIQSNKTNKLPINL